MSQEIGGDADLDEEALLSSFVAELEKNKPVSLKKLKAKKESEKTKYTSKEVLIDYLNRPASKYGNLNPFDVLDLDFNCTKQAVEQRERQLIKMAHPDLNMTRESEATNAFDVIKKSASILKTDDGRNHCAEVIEQAKDEIKSMMEKERAILRNQRKPSRLLEDNEDRFFDAVKKRVTVLFADMARLKEEGMKKESKKAQIASQIAEEQKFVDEEEKEFKKLYECGRTDRIRSWKKFQTEGASKSKKFKHFVEKNTNKPIPQRVADSHKYT